MRILDLFCGAGGAAMGYHKAGFDVVGVDINPQPNYPYRFIQADAMTYPLDGFDAIHASPPCQAYSVTASLHSAEYPMLIESTRERLVATGVPYVIENVVGAPLIDAIRLCGSSFGLGVRRHRLFEVRPLIVGVPPCAHHLQPEPVDVTGTGGPATKERHQGGGIHRKPRDLNHARQVMGIDWMSRRELAEAVPAAYTQWIGEQLIAELEVAA
jgi:DNA (cytosine-5)-methyltransferase 1